MSVWLPVLLLLTVTVDSDSATHHYRLNRNKDMETVAVCARDKTEKDGLGKEWTKYCYQYDSGIQEIVEFLREVSPWGWTYVVKASGEKRYDYRVPLHIQLCEGEDTDATGKKWARVCYPNGEIVRFQSSEEKEWTYLQGSGCHICSDRLILYDNADFTPRMLEIESKIDEIPQNSQEKDCVLLEFDTSGRGFFPDFTPESIKITYIRDIYGNYVWDEQKNRRLLGFPASKSLKNREFPQFPCLFDSKSGSEIDLETDELYPGHFYWLKNATFHQNYLLSTSDIDKSQGMYRISYSTGCRIEG